MNAVFSLCLSVMLALILPNYARANSLHEQIELVDINAKDAVELYESLQQVAYQQNNTNAFVKASERLLSALVRTSQYEMFKSKLQNLYSHPWWSQLAALRTLALHKQADVEYRKGDVQAALVGSDSGDGSCTRSSL